MRPFIVTLGIICLVLPISCIDGDGDRCGNLEYDPGSAFCIRPFDSPGSDTGPDKKDGGVSDAGVDTETDSEESPPPVLGASCESDADCAAYNADYCNLAATPPFCSLKDCTKAANRCPSTYTCCVSAALEWYPDHCMPDDVYEIMKELLCVP